MPKKRPIRVPPAPHVATVAPPKTAVTDVLLDWRFNLIVIGCMELMLIAFSIPREITRFRLNGGQKALWREDYTKAFYYYSLLDQDEPNNSGYLKCLGDAALGRRRFREALAYYQRAGGKDFGSADMKVQAARAFFGLAQSETNPARQNDYVDVAGKLVQAAHQEAPNDLKVNYWLGWFSMSSGDLINAAESFSRVRAEAIPGHLAPNEEQERLIKRADENLKRIHSLIFADKDYPLDLRGLEIVSTPTLARAPLPQGAKPTTAPVAPAPTKTPVITATPAGLPVPGAVTPAVLAPKSKATPAPAATPQPAAATPAAAIPAPAPKPAATPTPSTTPAPKPAAPTTPAGPKK